MISGIAIFINNILFIGILYDICRNIDRARNTPTVREYIFFFDILMISTEYYVC